VIALALATSALADVLGCARDASAAEPARPVVRVTLDAPQPVLVGQQVHMEVVVLVPNFFTGAPQFPEIEAPGASVELLDDAVNANDTIDGVGYAGVQRTYVVTPQQPGEVTVPAAKVSFAYAAEPGKPGVASTIEIPGQTLTARAAGVANSDDGGAVARAVPAPVARIGIEQSLDRSLDGLMTGDAVTRTITTFARGAAAMSIPAPTFTAPEGVRVYARDPVLTDVGVRDGGPGGRRVDRVTYVFEKPGRHTLPAVEVAWLDPADQQRNVSRAPEIVATVTANPSAAPAIAPQAAAAGEEGDDGPGAHPAPRRALPWAFAAAALLLVAAWAWRRWLPVVRALAAARHAARATSEEAYLARLDAACRANDAESAYRALAAWAHRAGWSSLAAACARRPQLAAATAELEAHLYGDHGDRAPWRGGALLAALVPARPGAADHRSRRARGVSLPALNP